MEQFYMYELLLKKRNLRTKIFKANSPAKVASFMYSKIGQDFTESFALLGVNGKLEVQYYCLISKGSMDTALVDPKVVFSALLKSGCAGFIAVHNHPSGKLSPSTEDYKTTERLKRGAELLGLGFHDHIIVTNSRQRYYSFREDGQFD